MKIDVVGVGTACVDLNATVTSVPKIDENVLMLDYHKHLGGPVATALATLQRLGASTQYMGMLGDDEYGRLIIEGMEEEGIDTSALHTVAGETSPFSFVMVDSMTGGRSIVHNPGCRFRIPANCVDREAIGDARLLHVDMAAPAVFAACEAAGAAGVSISVDANFAFSGLEELLKISNIFIPAKRLACELTGKRDPIDGAKKLLADYRLDLVVVTCGIEGSIALTPEEMARFPGFEVEVVDTTGAGDVFHGAYLYAHLKEWSLETALRFANGAAALMCTSQSGWAGIPTLPEVENFLQARDGASDD